MSIQGFGFNNYQPRYNYQNRLQNQQQQEKGGLLKAEDVVCHEKVQHTTVKVTGYNPKG